MRGGGRLGVAARADALRQPDRCSHRSDGVSVPNVEVVATNQDTQVAYPATSNDQGIYTTTALPLGTYVIKARAQTFRPFEKNPIKLESGQNARIDITLTVGVTEQVEVTAVSRILQTQNAVVGEVISGMTIEHMPLNGRNFSQLALLLPGVFTTESDSFTQPKNFGSGHPFVNGQREQENNYTLDGGLARAPEAITFDSLVRRSRPATRSRAALARGCRSRTT